MKHLISEKALTKVQTQPTDRPSLQIVIAWTEKSAEFVEQIYIGGGEHKNVFRDITVAKTCMWLNDGRQSDVAKARQYASSEIPGAKVFTYQEESDPLSKAKQDILKSRKAKPQI